MLLSRFRPGQAKKRDEEQKKRNEGIKRLDEFLERRDYTGAISLIQHRKNSISNNVPDTINTLRWLGYCHFHAADYKSCSEDYETLIALEKNCPNEAHLFQGCALFFMGMYEETRKAAEKGPKNPLQNRLLFHVAHKLNDEKQLMFHHAQLKHIIEDQLCLSAIHYMRSHYDEAAEIYKEILKKNKNYIALNVYLALCYYKLDYYDQSMEYLQIYLDKFEDSAIGVNLKACNQYRLYNSKAADNELKSLKNLTQSELSFAKDIILHNTCVFRNGDGALQLLPTLIDVIPEARLNLAIYHLKKDDYEASYALMNRIEPQSTYEHLLKAITCCVKGNEEGSAELLKAAASFFRIVGESSAEKDTITGRECMASALFIQRQFDDVLVYLNSIKPYLPSDDIFHFNLGQTFLFVDNFLEAERTLLLVNGHQLRTSITYCLALAKAYISNGKALQAWNLYQKERHLSKSTNLLQLIANESYRLEEYVYAAKAFEELESRENGSNISYLNTAKRSACVGVIKMFTVDRCSINELRDAINILERDNNPISTNVIAVTRKWAVEYNIYF